MSSHAIVADRQRRWVARRLGSRPPLHFALGTLFAFLVGWNADISDPDTGLDSSWQAGLYMATRDGLDFGKEIVFTYGPLGFLKFPATYDVELAALAFGYVVTVELLTAAVLVWAAWRWSRSWLLAAAMAAVATSLLADARIWEFGGSAPIQVLAVVACAHAMRDDAPPWLRTGLAIGGGVLVGIEILGKLNLGVIVAVMVVATLAVASNRRRLLAAFGLSFLATATAAWFLTGQSAANVDDYLRSSIEMVRGWPLAVGSGAGLGLLDLLALVAASIVIAASWITTRGLTLRKRAFLVGLVTFFLLGIFKSSFTPEGDHNFIFFSSAVGLWFAFRWEEGSKLPIAAFVALVGVYFVVVALNPISAGKSTQTVVVGVNPLNNRPTGLLDTVSPGTARARLQDEYGVSDRALALIGDRPVHIAPKEASVAWAYRLNWAPIPIFQPNLVTTPELDRLNADSLEAPRGPSTILREAERGESLPPPATTAAMLCRFRHLYADARWQVLLRAPDRCGPARVLRRVTVDPGETLRVPRIPNAMVRAIITGLEPGLIEAGAIGLLPRLDRTITVNGTARSLQANIASNGLVLRAPGSLDYPGGFGVSPQARTIALDSADGPFNDTDEITVEFRAYPVVDPR